MKKKITILLTGLLLAVGWTNSAQAQLLRESDRAVWTNTPAPQVVIDKANSLATLHHQARPNKLNAPRRANTVTADVVHEKAWYAEKTYTWYPSLSSSATGQTAYYTDVVTNPYQMAFLVMNIYMDSTIPGILYDEVYQDDTEYPDISNGWGITDVTPPTENGYTVLLVKVKDNVTFPRYTYTATGLIDTCFVNYESIELLTDGLRVGEGTTNAGTVFTYSGTLNKFFFISKGKTAQFGSYAPFYNMYEEFSPTTTDTGAEITDFYSQMTAGEYYPIVHDCASVSYLEHYFSMTGKDGTEEKSLSNLVFYIPDDRSTSPSDGYVYRNYDHQPQVGLYTIHLDASAVPSATQDTAYDVTLDWTSSLNTMVSNDVPQTYEIYTVEFDDNGNRIYVPLDTVNDITTYTYTVPQYQYSYPITYIIKGYPTDATNKDEFFTWSNIDDVQIPGWFDFLVLERERYESDFVISEEKNYYRNYLYPTNIAANTGMTLGQLKHEWPNQTASYILYRDETGVAMLEMKAVGDKVYYRIRYYQDTQVTTGPNDINMDIEYINND